MGCTCMTSSLRALAFQPGPIQTSDPELIHSGKGQKQQSEQVTDSASAT